MTAARKLTPQPSPPKRPMSARELLAEGLKRVDIEVLGQADREYGDDFERELADLEAGRHPSQRSRAR